MASIMPEPVVMTISTNDSINVFTNRSKITTKDIDSVSSNDEHVFKYLVQHPNSKLNSSTRKYHDADDSILGLFPPPQIKTQSQTIKKFKKPTTTKILKKVKMDDNPNEDNLLDVFSPITDFFTNEDDFAPIVHNFFNIKMTPSEKLKTSTVIDTNSYDGVNRIQLQNYRRNKRNMNGVDLQKPKHRTLSINTNSNVSLSSPTARVRMYSFKNKTLHRIKRDNTSVNVDLRRNEPRYYQQAERPQVRVKRVVHNPPFYSRGSQVFSSKYLVADQENSETLPEEINVAFSTTPKSFYESTTTKPIYESTTKFIPAIAFGDSKTKIINFNDSVANSTNDFVRTQFDKKGSLIYVINPDTGHGKWMQVVKVQNEEDTKSALMNGPVYLEKKGKDGVAEESIGKFGFNSNKDFNKDLFKNFLMPNKDHRFKSKLPSIESVKMPSIESIKMPSIDSIKIPNMDSIKIPKESKHSKKSDCPILKRMKKKQVCNLL